MNVTLPGKRNFIDVIKSGFLNWQVILELPALFWIIIILSLWVQCNDKDAEKRDVKQLEPGKEESVLKQSLKQPLEAGKSKDSPLEFLEGTKLGLSILNF